MLLGLRRDRKGVRSKGPGVGFKVGPSKKSKEWVVGFQSLDPKNHSVVILDENSNPNILPSVDDNFKTGAGIHYTLQPNVVLSPSTNSHKGKEKLGEPPRGITRTPMTQSVPIDKVVADIICRLETVETSVVDGGVRPCKS